MVRQKTASVLDAVSRQQMAHYALYQLRYDAPISWHQSMKFSHINIQDKSMHISLNLYKIDECNEISSRMIAYV